jgi:pSer/pThr/pTyr-binding forkhead associated (FHA) protein
MPGGSSTSNSVRLRLIRGDGGEGMTFPVNEEENQIGRSVGPVMFPDDPTVSPHHASIFRRGDAVSVRDAGSRNGTYIRLVEPKELGDGEVFMCGEQVMRFEMYRPPGNDVGPDGAVFGGTPVPPWRFRVVQLLPGGQPGRAVCSYTATLTIGREDCDMNFPVDRFISRYHTRIEERDGKFFLRDLDSRNGTYGLVREERPLSVGDYVFVGRQLMRVEAG